MSTVHVTCDGLAVTDLARYLGDLLEAVAAISGYEFEVHRADGEHDRSSKTGRYIKPEEAAASPDTSQHENAE